jgi:branched-chain amino acid transport system substrate-binding protein
VINVATITSASVIPTQKLSEPAIKAWEKSVNDNGGIGGHPVKVHVIDDKVDPATVISSLTRLKQTEGIVAVIGAQGSTTTQMVNTIEKLGLPVIGGGPSGPEWHDNKYFFGTTTDPDVQGYGALVVAQKAGAKKLAVITCTESPICAQSVQGFEKLAPELNMEIVYSALLPATTPSYTANCIAAKDEGADSIYVVLTNGVEATDAVLSQCSDQGFNPINVTASNFADLSTVANKNFNRQPGTWIQNPVYPWFNRDSDKAGVKAMFEGLQKYGDGILENPDMGSLVASQWASGTVFAAGLNALDVSSKDKVTSEDVMNGLWSLPADYDAEGLTPPLKYNKDKPANPVNCFFISQLVDGKYSLPEGDTALCQE